MRSAQALRRGRLVAYGAALERRFTRKGIEGSNPSPSAKLKASPKGGAFSLVEGDGDSNASASGTGRPEADRPWEIGWSN